jgi:hypothetical protein
VLVDDQSRRADRLPRRLNRWLQHGARLVLQWTAQPHFEVVTDRCLTLSWDAHQSALSVTRNVSLQNKGVRIGSIPNPPAARLASAVLSSAETLNYVSASDSTKSVDFPLPKHPTARP